MFKSLTGYRTFICTTLGMIVVALMWTGYIDQNTGMLIMMMLGFGSLAALRSAIRSEVGIILGRGDGVSASKTAGQ